MKDKKVIIYIILCIVIVFMISGLVYAKANYKEEPKTIVTKEPTNSKKDILAMIDIITVQDALDAIYSGETFTLENISHKYILKSTLNSINNDKSFSTDELRKTSSRMKVCINAGYYTEDYLLKHVNKIYGKNVSLDFKKDLTNTGFVYDGVNKNFYELCSNKIESNTFIDTYVYDYKEEKNTAYVYIAVAYGTEIPVMANGGATDKTVINIYRTVKRDQPYKTYVIEPDRADEFNLNKDNYNEFTKFKYTFTKEDGQFHFTKIELETNQ